jgi:hypothetical protein
VASDLSKNVAIADKTSKRGRGRPRPPRVLSSTGDGEPIEAGAVGDGEPEASHGAHGEGD